MLKTYPILNFILKVLNMTLLKIILMKMEINADCFVVFPDPEARYFNPKTRLFI